MNYELAKELKDKGFPNSNTWIDNGTRFFVDAGELVYIVPTLEELIEACGEPFDLHSQHFVGIKGEEKWCASTGHDGCDGYDDAHYAPTPLEAVARLWLALNKK